MRILLIEDDDIQRKGLCKIIEKKFIDIKIYEAATIKVAEQIVNEKEIDLFLIDINLPDGSGLDFAKKLRTIEKYSLTGIIFITTQVVQIIDAFKNTHCYDFIIKPYNADEVNKIIDVFYKKQEIEAVREGNHIIIPIESGVSVKIYEDEIIFIEYAHRNCIINTRKNKIQSKSMTLNTILKEIKTTTIVQSHKSYLVNTSYIEKIEKVYQKLWDIHFVNSEEKAQLSSNYRDEVLTKWEE
ncbi:MAG: LytR/AlgR family response regulator transcription factor [Clostridium sp.]